MTRPRRGSDTGPAAGRMACALAGPLLALLLSGCAEGGATTGAQRSGAAAPDTIALSFQEVETPSVYARELLGRRDRPSGAQGLWAAVGGLRRAETGRVVNIETGATTTVALFPGRVPAGEARLSNAAAVLIGIGSEPTRVRITAIRREPVLVAP